MPSREDISALMSYVLSEDKRMLLLTKGPECVPKETRVAALRGLQDLHWIDHAPDPDDDLSCVLTVEGQRILTERPSMDELNKSTQEHIAALKRLDSPRTEIRTEVLRRFISTGFARGDLDSALAQVCELKELATPRKDFGSLAFALLHQGHIEVIKNHWKEALESYLAALEMYTECGDRKGVCTTSRALGIVYGNRGDYASAMRCFETSLSLARDLGDVEGAAKAESNLAIVYDLQGRYEDSEKAGRSCLDYFLSTGDFETAARISNNLGVLHMSRENFSLAIDYLEKTIESTRKMGNKQVLAAALVNSGYCHGKLGNMGRIVQYTDEAVSILKEPNDLNMLSLAYRNYGIAETMRPDPDAASEWFEKSVRTAEASGVEDTLAACCYEYGVALIGAMANPRMAKKLLKRSSSTYRSIGNMELARRAETRLSAA